MALRKTQLRVPRDLRASHTILNNARRALRARRKILIMHGGRGEKTQLRVPRDLRVSQTILIFPGLLAAKKIFTEGVYGVE